MKALGKAGHVFIFAALFAAAVAVIMLLWNALIPSIIGWTAINYWQAGGLLILTRILFGGPFHHAAFMMHNPREHAHLHERLRRMSFNERREFIRKRMTEYSPFDERGEQTAQEKKMNE